jgi:phage terminase large subunit-like protein
MLGLWEKPDGEAWEVPRAEVDATVHAAFSRYEVARFYVDPPYWQEALDAWAREYGDTVAAFWTNRETAMSRALERLHTAVLGRAVTHDGDPNLAAHIANAHLHRSRSGVTIRKERAKSPRKIDAAIAAALAFEARADAVAAGLDKPKRAARLYAW